MRKSDAGKGDARRPCLISPAEYELRYDLAFGRISRAEFEKKLREIRKCSAE